MLISKRLEAINGLLMRNHGRGLIKHLLKVVDVLRLHRTASDVKLVSYFAFWAVKIAASQGMRGLVLHLKTCQVLTQQAVGQYRVSDLADLKRRVKRSRTGFPLVIPRAQRILLRKGDGHAVKLGLSLFGLYRILTFIGQVNINTIITSGKEIPREWLLDGENFVKMNFGSALPVDWKPLQKRLPLPVAFPIQKSGPSANVIREGENESVTTASSSLVSLAIAARSWLSHPLYACLKSYLSLIGVTNLTARMQGAGTQLYENMPFKPSESSKGLLGKLGIKEEPAGKMRVFAMVDAGTHWVMRPLHDMVFSILRFIPQDGTFDQPKPAEALKNLLLRRLSEGKPVGVYSIDLSAATDRLPIRVQVPLMEAVFSIFGFGYGKKDSRKLAELWASLLVDRDYRIKFSKLVPGIKPRVSILDNGIRVIGGDEAKPREEVVVRDVRYAVGQPMGALSSGSSLAITHHAIVQYAFYLVQKEKSLPYRGFSLYAILGDDVVIGDKSVAKKYLEILDIIGVQAGLAKSLVSHNKVVMEFAKKFGIPERCDQVSLKELTAMSISMRLSIVLIEKYQLTGRQLCRFYGIGYKVMSMESSDLYNLPSRLRLPWIGAARPGGPGAISKRWTGWIVRRTMNGSNRFPLSPALLQDILFRVRKTRDELLVSFEERRREIERINSIDPRTYTGVTAFEGDDLFRNKSLAIYNSIEEDPSIEGGVDADRDTKTSRMLRDAIMWTTEVVPELLQPEVESVDPNLLVQAQLSAMMGKSLSSLPFQLNAGELIEAIEDTINDVIELDDLMGTLSERAPQHRMDDEKEFTDIITGFARWQDGSKPVWKTLSKSTQDTTVKVPLGSGDSDEQGPAIVEIPYCNPMMLTPGLIPWGYNSPTTLKEGIGRRRLPLDPNRVPDVIYVPPARRAGIGFTYSVNLGYWWVGTTGGYSYRIIRYIGSFHYTGQFLRVLSEVALGFVGVLGLCYLLPVADEVPVKEAIPTLDQLSPVPMVLLINFLIIIIGLGKYGWYPDGIHLVSLVSSGDFTNIDHLIQGLYGALGLSDPISDPVGVNHVDHLRGLLVRLAVKAADYPLVEEIQHMDYQQLAQLVERIYGL